jgi:hypothetical protein
MFVLNMSFKFFKYQINTLSFKFVNRSYFLRTLKDLFDTNLKLKGHIFNKNLKFKGHI